MDYKMINQKLTSIYLACMFSLFLFFFQDGYYDTVHAKYFFFMVVSFIYLVIGFGCSILGTIQEKQKTIRFTMIELLLGIFVFCVGISVLFSQYREYGLTGEFGRNIGLYYYIVLFLTFLQVKNTFQFNRKLFYVLACSVMVLSLYSILQFFYIDPLQFTKYLSDYQSQFYTSTIGNTNYAGSLYGMLYGFFLMLYCYSTNKKESYFYYFTLLMIGIAGIIICADSFYLGIGTSFLIASMFVVKKREFFQKLLFVWIGLLISAHIIGYIVVSIDVRAIHSISYLLAYSKISYGMLLLSCVILFVVMHNPSISMKQWEKIVRIIWIAFFLSIICGMVYYTINPKNNFLSYYLSLGNNWGTGRGEIWAKGISAYSEMNFLQKLFGYGSGCILMLFVDTFGETMQNFDTVHNEYLQLLLGVGIVGLMTYLGYLFYLVNALWKEKQDTIIQSILVLIVAYSVQAVVNITQPLSFTLFMLFGAVACSMIQSTKKE